MAIFKRPDQATTKSANTTIIAAGTSIEGEIDSQCRIHVDGSFIGPMKTGSIVAIGKTGIVEGDIKAKELFVSGCLTGTANCAKIHILAEGKISGKITSKVLMIEKGSIFHGQHIHAEASKQAKLSAIANNARKDTRDNVTAIPSAIEKAI